MTRLLDAADSSSSAHKEREGWVSRISSVAGDFNGDQARDQLLAYAELDAAGQPRQWHVRVLLASGGVADLALANSPDWIGPNGLVARRAVDANGDGRDERFVTSTGGASNLFVLAGCQLRQVRVAGAGALQILVGGSVGHAEGFDCQTTDRHGRRLLTSGASSGPTSNPMAGPATPGPRPATAGPATPLFVRWRET